MVRPVLAVKTRCTCTHGANLEMHLAQTRGCKRCTTMQYYTHIAPRLPNYRGLAYVLRKNPSLPLPRITASWRICAARLHLTRYSLA
eukprot:9994258-Lingulodinium_polyedra.AAC.1